MRPDKKKRNRGRHTEKSEDTPTQDKNINSKIAPEKEEAAKTKTEESKEQSQNECTDKAKSSESATPAKEVSNDNLPTPTLRRETDALKETKKPLKRQIFSDWKEYDKPILPEEIEEERLSDFSYLIQQNITEDNYFKFKHERQWESDACNINTDLFNLNLQELSAGLQCIPFYERLNISSALFSSNEIKRMESYAKDQEKVYDAILSSQECNPLYNIFSKELKIQPEEQYYMEVGEEVTSESIVSQSENLPLENELVKCLTSEKEKSVDETSLIQEKESKIEESQLNFFNSDDQPKVENKVSKKINVENESIVENKVSKTINVENKSCPDQEINTTVTDNNHSSVSLPIKEQENEVMKMKHENEVIEETVMKPAEDGASIDINITEASPMDMNSVFESSPLGQRVKPQRSRESKVKSKPKVESSRDEDTVLDSLLSLKEPSIPADDSKKKEVEETENEGDSLTNDLKSIVIHDKKENLEAWLDSMLDD